ncbi:hypothetical protein Droror1_Dr00001328 [Drosera rotundifolia]
MAYKVFAWVSLLLFAFAVVSSELVLSDMSKKYTDDVRSKMGVLVETAAVTLPSGIAPGIAHGIPNPPPLPPQVIPKFPPGSTPPRVGPPRIGPPRVGPPRIGPPRVGPPRIGPRCIIDHETFPLVCCDGTFPPPSYCP